MRKSTERRSQQHVQQEVEVKQGGTHANVVEVGGGIEVREKWWKRAERRGKREEGRGREKQTHRCCFLLYI